MIRHESAAALPAQVELLVIGAGPAGLAAATEASAAGAKVLLLDENAAPGGQIWRNIGAAPKARATLLGPDYQAGSGVLADFVASGSHYACGAAVWGLRAVSPGFEVSVTLGDEARVIKAAAVILATGAMERPFPIPGWTLPGVMGAGAIQTLLKSSGMVPDVPHVLVGSGPLLYLLGSQLLAAGARPAALVETSGLRDMIAAARHLPGFVASPLFLKGMALYARLRRQIPVHRAKHDLHVLGESRAEGIGWRKGKVAAELVILHQGVVPVLNLSIAAGCQIAWDAAQACFKPVTGPGGASTVAGIFIAGDGAGIGGASAAYHAGKSAAMAALDHLVRSGVTLPKPPTAQAMTKAERQHQRSLRGRAFIDRAFPAAKLSDVPDDTIICRCEALTAGQIRQAAGLGLPGPNQLKTFLRAGMGPCQGRMCGHSVTALIADTQSRAAAEVGYFRTRSPVKPLRLSTLADLPVEDRHWRAAHSENLEKEPTP